MLTTYNNQYASLSFATQGHLTLRHTSEVWLFMAIFWPSGAEQSFAD